MWFSGTSLLVQWLRLCAPNAEGPGLIPGQGTGSHNAETNAYPLQLTIPRAIQLRPLQLNKLKEKKRLLLSLQSDSYSSQSVLSSCYLSFCFVDYAKAFDCVDHNKLENSSRDGNTRLPDLPLEKPVCRSGNNS